MNKYDLAVTETESVLSEYVDMGAVIPKHRLALQIVERLIAKGVIQSTDPEDLVRQP